VPTPPDPATDPATVTIAEFLRAFADAATHETFAIDRELRYTMLNQAHRTGTRRRYGQVPRPGDPATDLVRDTGARSRYFTAYQRALAGETLTIDLWDADLGGHPEPLECRLTPIGPRSGPPIGVAVTLRRREEGAGRTDSGVEHRYRALLDSAVDGIVILRPDGAVLECNESFARLVGRSMDEVVRGAEWEWTASGDRAAARETLRRSLDHERVYETIIRQRNGAYVPVEVRAAPVRIAGGPAVIHTVRDITERRRAELAIAEREARLRAIFDHAPLGLGVADLTSGQVITANAAMCAIYGRDLSELTQSPIGTFTHPEDRDAEADGLRRLRAGEVADYTLRKRYVQPDGNCVPAEIRVIRLPDLPGSPPLALGIATDLRQLASAEHSLRESEARYRRLTDHAQDMIYRYGVAPPEGIQYVNPAVERLLGYTPAQCYADPLLPARIIYPDDRSTFEAVLRGEKDPSTPQVLRWIHADGHIVWMEHRGTPVMDHEGRVIALEGIGRDISDQVAREEHLRLLARAVEQAAEVVMIADRAGKIREVNRAFETVTGYTREEAIGRTPRLLKSGRQDAGFYQEMWNTLRAGRTFSGTVINRRKDGSEYFAEMMVTPVRDQEGTVTHFVGLHRDVTRERSRDEQLRQAQKMEAMGQVTGGIAHDFNNILTVIQANAELVASGLPSESDAMERVTDLLASAKHGSTLVRQLLAFGRKGILAPVSTELAPVLEHSLEILRRVVPASIRILPLRGSAPPVLADPAAVGQILLNLATNARDAMPEGGDLEITLAPGNGSGANDPHGTRPFVVVQVRDTGAGMSAETLRRAFEPFYTTKPAGLGTGLGLAMVHGLMEQHGGFIELASTPGTGTVVTLGFPMAADRPRPKAAPAAKVGHDRIHGTILLAEDDPALRRATARTLERGGATVITAADGEEAWDLWRAHRDTIDIVLTDAVMPRCGGPDLARRLRAHDARCPILLLTGYTAEDFTDLDEAVTVLPKPWTVQELLAAVDAARSAAAA